ncbi:hypothetical protein BH10BDE1_BH10BDE1_26050 [soil metagenome]
MLIKVSPVLFLALSLATKASPPNRQDSLEFCGTQFALLPGWEVPERTKAELEAAQLERLRRAVADTPRQLAIVSPGAKKTARFELRQVRRVDSVQIQDLKPLDASVNFGNGYHAIARGTFEGRSVFVKISALRDDGRFSVARTLPGGQASMPRDSTLFKNEVAWVKRLSDLDAGPKFEGVTVFGSQTANPHHFAVVTQYFPGTHLDQSMVKRFEEPGFFPPDFKPTPELFESLNHLKSVIRSEGITSIDLQLRVDSRRAVIVDPEFITLAKLQSEVAEAEHQIDRIIIGLKGLLDP